MVTRGGNVRETGKKECKRERERGGGGGGFTLTAMIDPIFLNWHVDLRAYVLRLYWVCSVSVMFNKLPDWLSGCVIVPSGCWVTAKMRGRGRGEVRRGEVRRGEERWGEERWGEERWGEERSERQFTQKIGGEQRNNERPSACNGGIQDQMFLPY